MHYVINADDFGMDKETSDAITKAFLEHKINRTTTMVNMDYFENAYEESIKGGFSTLVGLHLNLTQGIPLTDKIKKIRLFCDQHGCFNGMCMQTIFSRIVPFSKDVNNAVYEEIEAQFKKYLEFYGTGAGGHHLDSHHHVHKNMNILPICIALAKKYGFNSMRYAKTAGSKVNCGYNKIVNYMIRKNLETSYYMLFDSVHDYATRRKENSILDFFEVECHPKEIRGVLYDGETQLPSIDFYEK